MAGVDDHQIRGYDQYRLRRDEKRLPNRREALV